MRASLQLPPTGVLFKELQLVAVIRSWSEHLIWTLYTIGSMQGARKQRTFLRPNDCRINPHSNRWLMPQLSKQVFAKIWHLIVSQWSASRPRRGKNNFSRTLQQRKRTTKWRYLGPRLKETTLGAPWPRHQRWEGLQRQLSNNRLLCPSRAK